MLTKRLGKYVVVAAAAAVIVVSFLLIEEGKVFRICLKMTILLIIFPQRARDIFKPHNRKVIKLNRNFYFPKLNFRRSTQLVRGRKNLLVAPLKTFNTHACCGQTKHSLIVFQFSDGTSMAKAKEREKLFVVYKQTMGEQHLCY